METERQIGHLAGSRARRLGPPAGSATDEAWDSRVGRLTLLQQEVGELLARR